MEDWITELFFSAPETEQQKYDRKVAAARAAAERRKDAPRNELERAMRWGEDNIWGEPEPQWYDNPEVLAVMTDEQKRRLLAAERREQPRRQSPFMQTMQAGLEGLGQMFKSGEADMGERRPAPGSWRGPVYDASTARRAKSETTRMDLELELLGQLARSLEPSRKSDYAAAAPAPPPGFGSSTMPYYADFEGESWTDPEVQREMEERRFRQMMAMRGRPLKD